MNTLLLLTAVVATVTLGGVVAAVSRRLLGVRFGRARMALAGGSPWPFPVRCPGR